MIQRNGNISHVYGSEEIILKFPHYPKKFTDLMQSYQNTQDVSHRCRTNSPKIDNRSTIEDWIVKAMLIKKIKRLKLELPHSLYSDYTTMLQ